MRMEPIQGWNATCLAWENRNEKLDGWPLMSLVWPTVFLATLVLATLVLLRANGEDWVKEPLQIRPLICYYYLLRTILHSVWVSYYGFHLWTSENVPWSEALLY